MPQHKTDNSRLPITSPPVKAISERVIRLHGARQPASCPVCFDPLTGNVCLKCNKVRAPVKKRRLQVVTPAVAQARCGHAHVQCVTCGAVLENGGERSFYPRGPNGGFIVQHRLWNGEIHPLEWFFGWEHPDTGDYYAAMPAPQILGVKDMCAILDCRESWLFARSARWTSRVGSYEIKVRTIDWMLEVYYDKANLERVESDAFNEATYSRVKPQTRTERRIAIRMAHVEAGCFAASCRALHRPPRPRDRKR